MKLFTLICFLKLSSFFRLFPKLTDKDDIFLISSGPLQNVSFIIRIGIENKILAYNYHIVLIPKDLKETIEKLDKHIDIYIKKLIDHEIGKISRRYG